MIEGISQVLSVDIDTWFADCQKCLRVEIERIPAADNKDWKIETTSDGRPNKIVHRTERLHKITFLRAWEPPRNKWVDRCLLEPIAEGKNNFFAMVLLAKYKNKYLVQAKGEPGNNTPCRVALTTTVQASYVNISMNLEGNIPFTEFYYDPACRKFPILQDGAHLLNKINEVCLIELQEKIQDIPQRFYWATLAEIRKFAKRGLVSEHLMQTLGMLSLLSRKP